MYEKYKVGLPCGQSGKWEVVEFEVSKEQAMIERIRSATHGGRSVPAGKYTALRHNNHTIMSDTPDEIRDHFQMISAAKGDVHINGLGLGVVLKACIEKENVTHVTVVEKSIDVINLCGEYYKKIYGDQLTIVHGDAFEYKPQKNKKYGAVWHDIWPTITSDNLPEIHKLHRKYGRHTNWQGSWARSLCERHRDKENKGWDING